jgi:hypothetical protein
MKSYNKKTFDIFLIFIKYRKKNMIIKELEKLKAKNILKGDMNQLYEMFKPMLLPIGELFSYVVLNHIKNVPKDVKSKMRKLRKNLINSIQLKIESMNKPRTLKKKQANKKKRFNKKTRINQNGMRKKDGGFLFMLEDKKDEPITGTDIKNMLDNYEKAFDLLFYTQYGKDSVVTGGEGSSEVTYDIANPFTGTSTILALSRKNVNGALYNQMSQLYRGLTSFDELLNIPNYYEVYKLYMDAYEKSEAKSNSTSSVTAQLNKGPPEDPTNRSDNPLIEK